MVHPLHVDAAVYSFLLGGYLGDGCIVRINQAKTSLRLTISLDDAHPGVQEAFRLALVRTMPTVNVRLVRKPGCSDVTAVHQHLACLFPQHGPGRKHLRDITLEHWQAEAVVLNPWEFLRGLIYTDGCSYTNWTVRAGKRYEYLTFAFSNRSEDILWLAEEISGMAGLEPDRQGQELRWARRPDVAALVAHVGTKHDVDAETLPRAWDDGDRWHQRIDQRLGRMLPLTPHCPDCGIEASRRGNRCKRCAGRLREPTRIRWPPPPELRALVERSSLTAAGRELGVSDNAVRKRLRRYG